MGPYLAFPVHPACSRGSVLRVLRNTKARLDRNHFHSGRARRAEKPNGAGKDTRTSLSIPGPTWLWTTAVQPLTYPFRAYSRVQSRKPYTVQLCSSLVIYFLGDLSAQFIERPRDTDSDSFLSTSYDAHRSMRAFVIGGVFSIPSYHWFLYLSHNFNLPASTPYASVLSLLLKITINQAFFTPFFNTYFFGMQSLLSNFPLFNSSLLPSRAEGETPSATALLTPHATLPSALTAAQARVAATVPQSWYDSCKFWPLVTAFSFTFVKPQSRSVFAGVVAIGWQSYLGMLNRWADEDEKRKKEMG